LPLLNGPSSGWELFLQLQDISRYAKKYLRKNCHARNSNLKVLFINILSFNLNFDKIIRTFDLFWNFVRRHNKVNTFRFIYLANHFNPLALFNKTQLVDCDYWIFFSVITNKANNWCTKYRTFLRVMDKISATSSNLPHETKTRTSNRSAFIVRLASVFCVMMARQKLVLPL